MADAIHDSLDGVFEFRDKEIDAEEILAKLRQRVATRRAQAAAQGVDYDTLVETLFQKASAGKKPYLNKGNESVSELVELNQKNAGNIFVQMLVTGKAWPALNNINLRIRREAHQLVLFYVNMLAGKQAEINTEHARTMAALYEELKDSRSQIEALREEVAKLKSNLLEQ